MLPHANADAMNLHLAEISGHVTPGAHAVVTLDGAGWHQTGGRLRLPENLSLLKLPPYSPELNPTENILQIPVHRGQPFRRVADSIPVIADSF